MNSDEPVIYFQSDKLMKVNFNPDIELLIREVKMLKILGYNIPSELEKVSETGKKFLRQAKYLEQVLTNTNYYCNLILIMRYTLDNFIP